MSMAIQKKSLRDETMKRVEVIIKDFAILLQREGALQTAKHLNRVNIRKEGVILKNTQI